MQTVTQTLAYLAWVWNIKYLGGNQIETFTLTYTHTHTHTLTETYTYMLSHTHTNIQTFLKTHRRISSYGIYITDVYQTYITEFTVIAKDIILRLLLWKRLVFSGNCTNLSDQGNKVKTKEVELWSWIFSFSNVYASELSYIFMDEINFSLLELCAGCLTIFSKL